MVRGLIIGSTDFSTQSLKEIKKELKRWSDSAELTINDIKETISELNQKNDNYFDKVAPFNFQGHVQESLHFYENVIETCDEIISGLENEFQLYHVNIAENIGKNANLLYTEFRRSWKDSDVYAYYEDEEFHKLENIYRLGSDMLGDLIDFNNLALRLEDFIGRTDNNTTKGQKNPVNQVSNKFYLHNSSNINIDNKTANSMSEIEKPQLSLTDQIIKKLKKFIPFIKSKIK